MSFSKSRDEDYDDSADICRRDGEEDEQPFQAKAIFGDALKNYYHLHAGAL